MSPQVRHLALFFSSSAITYGHGTETVGMLFGSMASVLIVTVGLAIVPFRPARRGVVIGSALAAIIAMWVVAFSAVGTWLYMNIKQSVFPWILFVMVPSVITAGIVYFAFGRPKSSDK